LNNALRAIKEDISVRKLPIGIVVRNGDVVTDINIKNLIRVAQKNNDLITMAVTKMQSPYGIIEFADRKITSFKEKPTLELYINAGIYYIKKGAFPYFAKEYDRREIEHTVFPELVEERKIAPYYENCFWRSIDGIKDLEAVRREYENKQDKPWGYEKTMVNNEKYLVKELYLKKGFKTSLHYHPNKDESLHVLEGEGYIDFENKRISANAGSVIRIGPKKIHSIVAVENLRIYEYSTPHPEDTVRVKDYYGRRK
ncbi:MAG: sugar phosphate nucleotidyltransferase, partial [Candidatus Hydrothermarchaeota archaeon]|nr:sugar phosphate nucleotidyltransferase [Candidatus Hydrothermarchaeota archaeon]